MVVGRVRLLFAWLTSVPHRLALETWRQTRRRFRHARDSLSREAEEEMNHALATLRRALLGPNDVVALESAGRTVRETSQRLLPGPKRRRLAETIEVLLIICLLVTAARTFFVLPSQIPTGSMQPTLYGVTLLNRLDDPQFAAPGLARGLVERLLFGRIHYQVIARGAGRLEEILPPEPRYPWLGFPRLLRQRFRVGEEWYTIPVPPVMPASPVANLADHEAFLLMAGVNPTRQYGAGEPLLQAIFQAGDHLLVDRFTYHWRRPGRGEIVVFQPTDIEELDADTYYLKRLVGLPGERIRIADDRHVWIDGSPIGKDAPGFRQLYDFEGPPEEDHYSGHVNERVARRYRRSARGLSPQFVRGEVERVVPPGHAALLGDNTLESLDSRRFGPVGMEQIVGRAWLVYWPWSRRIGFGFE